MILFLTKRMNESFYMSPAYKQILLEDEVKYIQKNYATKEYVDSHGGGGTGGEINTDDLATKTDLESYTTTEELEENYATKEYVDSSERDNLENYLTKDKVYHEGDLDKGVQIGQEAGSLLADTIAIGNNTSAAGVGTIGIGNEVLSSGERALAVGNYVKATGANAIAIGCGRYYAANDHKYITASGDHSIHIGSGKTTTTFITSGDNSISIGRDNSNTHTNSILIGNSLTSAEDNAAIIGDSTVSTTSFGIIKITTSSSGSSIIFSIKGSDNITRSYTMTLT
jgi:hypothetical protein